MHNAIMMSAQCNQKRRHNAHKVRAIAVKAQVDPRTVVKYLESPDSVSAMSAERIAKAIMELT